MPISDFETAKIKMLRRKILRCLFNHKSCAGVGHSDSEKLDAQEGDFELFF